MNRHTDQLYRLAELPAFIEEALSNVSLKGIITAYLHAKSYHGIIHDEIDKVCHEYAEQWVDDWMENHPGAKFSDPPDDPEIQAIEAGVKLFSNPDCKAGLPE